MITVIKELRSFFVLFFLILFFYSFYSFGIMTIIGWSLLFLMAWLFRSKIRTVPSHPLAILSPVDGLLSFIQSEEIPFLNVDGIHSKIIKPFYKEQLIYSPIEGTVKEVWFPHSKGADGANCVLIETDEKDTIIVKIKRNGFGFSRFNIQPGQRVGQGRQIGLCVFCNIVDLYMPSNAKVEIESDDVKAVHSVIAELVHEN